MDPLEVVVNPVYRVRGRVVTQNRMAGTASYARKYSVTRFVHSTEPHRTELKSTFGVVIMSSWVRA